MYLHIGRIKNYRSCWSRSNTTCTLLRPRLFLLGTALTLFRNTRLGSFTWRKRLQQLMLFQSFMRRPVTSDWHNFLCEFLKSRELFSPEFIVLKSRRWFSPWEKEGRILFVTKTLVSNKYVKSNTGGVSGRQSGIPWSNPIWRATLSMLYGTAIKDLLNKDGIYPGVHLHINTVSPKFISSPSVCNIILGTTTKVFGWTTEEWTGAHGRKFMTCMLSKKPISFNPGFGRLFYQRSIL